jgi:hypothetical protein
MSTLTKNRLARHLPNIYVLIILIIIVVGLCVLIHSLWQLHKYLRNDNTTTTDTSNPDLQQFNVGNFRTAAFKLDPVLPTKRDCSAETIYAFDTQQCRLMCRNNAVYVVSDGQCVDETTLNTGGSEQEPPPEQIPTDNETCDPQRGLLGFMVGNPQFGTTQIMCLSIDMGIQSDRPSEANQLCRGGELTSPINYLQSLPSLQTCKCPDDQVLAIIHNNQTIRMSGICVPKHLEPFLKTTGILYNPNIV